MKKKTKIIIGICVIAVLGCICLPTVVMAARLYLGVATEKVHEDNDVSNYEQYFGANVAEDFAYKNGADVSIFPASITEEMDVIDFKMVYYRPWNEEYLSYLVVKYDAQAYEKEVERIKKCKSTGYEYQRQGVTYGYYGATGFNENYEVLSVSANSYSGYVYALAEGDDTIIYVLLNFPDYHFSMDYEKYIKEEYLPIGFDATKGNEYEMKYNAG